MTGDWEDQFTQEDFDMAGEISHRSGRSEDSGSMFWMLLSQIRLSRLQLEATNRIAEATELAAERLQHLIEHIQSR